MRGVWFFLLFVLALAGWGMYFYSAGKDMGNVSYDVYEEEKDDVLNAAVEEAKIKQNLLSSKEQVLKQKEENLSRIEQEKQKLEAEYKSLISRVDALQAQYNELKKKGEFAFSELRQKDEIITEYKKKSAKLKRQNEGLQVEINALKGERDALRAQNERLKNKQTQMQTQMEDVGFLKRAIRKAKRLLFEKKKTEQRKRDGELLRKGNKGFVVFQGKNTLIKDVEILVIPADR